MKNNYISESSVADTQLEDKGLNNGLYNYRGGIFPMGGEIPPLFVQLLNI